MKAMVVILFLLVLLPISAPTARAQKDIMVDVSPVVLESGKMQTLTIELRNLGEQALENVTVRIVSDKTPVTILGVGEQFIGSIESYGAESIQFSLYVERSAGSAGYTLPISVFYQKKWEIIEYNTTVGIEIIGKKPVLEVNTEPITMGIGEERDVRIELVNVGNEAAKDVECSLSSDSVSLLSPSSELIEKLLPGEGRVINYKVTSNTSGVHSLLLNVTYNNISKSTKISCKVTGKPDLALTGMEINKNGSTYEITGNIANVGMDKALYVVLSVGDGVYPYKDYFVGTLEPNDFASFELHSSASTQKIPINITYRDIFNNLIEENRHVEVNAKESPAEKSSETLPLWIYLLTAIIAIFIVGIIAYSWTRGRK